MCARVCVLVWFRGKESWSIPTLSVSVTGPVRIRGWVRLYVVWAVIVAGAWWQGAIVKSALLCLGIVAVPMAQCSVSPYPTALLSLPLAEQLKTTCGSPGLEIETWYVTHVQCLSCQQVLQMWRCRTGSGDVRRQP